MKFCGMYLNTFFLGKKERSFFFFFFIVFRSFIVLDGKLKFVALFVTPVCFSSLSNPSALAPHHKKVVFNDALLCHTRLLLSF